MTNLPSAFKKINLVVLVALALLGVALWQAFAPYIQHPKEIKATKVELIEISSDDLAKMIKSPEKKRTILYLYASWCPLCHVLGAEWVRRAEKGEMEGAHVIFLSLDESKPEMIRYFVNSRYPAYFKPYIVKENGGAGIYGFIANGGSMMDNKLPHTLVIDSDGYVQSEFYGVPDAATLDKMLSDARS